MLPALPAADSLLTSGQSYGLSEPQWLPAGKSIVNLYFSYGTCLALPGYKFSRRSKAMETT